MSLEWQFHLKSNVGRKWHNSSNLLLPFVRPWSSKSQEILSVFLAYYYLNLRSLNGRIRLNCKVNINIHPSFMSRLHVFALKWIYVCDSLRRHAKQLFLYKRYECRIVHSWSYYSCIENVLPHFVVNYNTELALVKMKFMLGLN